MLFIRQYNSSDYFNRLLRRNWAFCDNNIGVTVSGHAATLTGTVDSLYQKRQAESIAWNARGIWEVENKLVVDLD
jgi:osmotically-inducible protein OsmY